jgi:hypothetical protein
LTLNDIKIARHTRRMRKERGKKPSVTEKSSVNVFTQNVEKFSDYISTLWLRENLIAAMHRHCRCSNLQEASLGRF